MSSGRHHQPDASVHTSGMQAFWLTVSRPIRAIMCRHCYHVHTVMAHTKKVTDNDTPVTARSKASRLYAAYKGSLLSSILQHEPK